MITLFLSLLMMTDTLDNRQNDGMPVDTLKEVTIYPDSLLPIDYIIRESLGQQRAIRVPSVSDILERVSPGLNDKILHPFAFKQRKHERRKKKQIEVLEQYDRVKTFDELLREAYELQLREDSLARLRKQ